MLPISRVTKVLPHAANAVAIDAELLEELDVTTHFTRDEIARLYRRFSSLDASSSGKLTKLELFAMPELKYNQMRGRLAKVWASELARDIYFRDFVRLLAPFAQGCPRETKLRFAFQIYDFDDDSRIGESDLRNLIYMLLLGTRDRRGAQQGPRDANRVRPVRDDESDDESDEELPSRTREGQGTAAAARARRVQSQRTDFSELVEEVVSQLFDEIDFDEDRTLSFDEWAKVVSNTDIESRLTLHP